MWGLHMNQDQVTLSNQMIASPSWCVRQYGHSSALPCRGFAFVDFLSKQEARSTADAVAGTHLYGRRLVSQ